MTAPLYQHVLADSVAPRIKTLAADWQMWEFAGGATHIEYDGEYGSERVWIVSGRATIEPNDGSPCFNVGPGDVVYFLSGFQCTWRVHDAPLVQRYGFFGFDGKEIKDAEVTCDVCGCDLVALKNWDDNRGYAKEMPDGTWRQFKDKVWVDIEDSVPPVIHASY